MATETNTSAYHYYRLTFGNTISAPKNDLPELILKQGERNSFKDSQHEYYITLHGVKINRKIYQPTEIEVELSFESKGEESINGSTVTVSHAPSPSDVTALLFRRMVLVEVLRKENVTEGGTTTQKENTYTIAKNCFVYELNPQLIRVGNGMEMKVKLCIFSMDKLMTLNKYSKAYVARKLGSEILKPESLEFGIYEENSPLVETEHSKQQFLMYKYGSESYEFIQPYLVQYNESFYDFMVRTSNRCGEFLFFEDGKLTLGLPETEKIVTLEGFESVTMQNTTAGPLVVMDYARDSVKDGVGEIQELNQTVIKKSSTGFPIEVFPAKPSTNSEVATDEYIFPLFSDKFSRTTREMFYEGDGADIAMFQAFKAGKTLFSNTLDAVGGVLGSLAKATIVDHGVQAALSGMQQSAVNKEMEKKFIEPFKNKKEQYDGNKAVEFSSLAAAGWTTLNYYNDIFKYEEAQQRQIVCVNMGTAFADVKLGQKVKIDGLEGIYVIIQIQQLSEEAWGSDYDKYNTQKSDKFTGKRSHKIFAIPSFKKESQDTAETFVPPVQPVPVIRKSGPQTAYVTENEDPKFQGRVRIAYPWQSDGSGLKAKIEECETNLKAIDTKLKDLKAQRVLEVKLMVLCTYFQDELQRYVLASTEERKKIMEEKNSSLTALNNDIETLGTEIKHLKTDIDNLKQAYPVDETKLAIKEQTLTQKQSELDNKKTKKNETEQLIANMKAAATEHDQRNGKDKTYKNPVNDNSVIKEHRDSWKNHSNNVNKINAEIKEAEKQKKTNKKELKEKVSELKQKVSEMASPWVRIATPMATPGGGSFYRPRVGDEVLVNFDNDNVERPYVVGSLFSKNVLTPDERYYRKQSPELQWKNVSMAISSPNGHHISFTDPEEGGSFVTNLISPGLGFYGGVLGFNKFASGGKDLAGGIHIGDRYGLYEIEMKSHKRAIEIKSPLGTVSINAFTGITISAPNGDVKIVGKNITLEAGNKVTINSGTNLPQPDFGEAPAGKTKAADITKAVIGGVASALVDQFASSVVDLSTIRHIIEVFVRPVDGTTLIKSRKFLKLEAGLGNATIKRDKYKDSTKESKEKEQVFYLELIKRVKFLNDQLTLFLDSYESLSANFYACRYKYINVMKRLFEDDKHDKIPDMAAKAKEKVANRDASFDFQMADYNSMLKDHVRPTFFYQGNKYKSDDEKFEVVKPVINAYYRAAYDIQYQCLSEHFKGYFVYDEGGDFGWLTKAMKDTAEGGWISEQVNSWQEVFDKEMVKSENYNNSSSKDPYCASKKIFFRRAFLLLFLKHAYDAPENKKENPGGLDKLMKNTFKYFYIGYEEKDVTNPKNVDLSVDYWWKRQVHVIDRYSQNSLLRTLWDSTAGKLLNDIYDNTIGMFKKETDRQVWGAEKEGQILFSDREDATISFEGEGVHRETDANQGNIAHLKWILRDM